jgi:hypothetical protein
MFKEESVHTLRTQLKNVDFVETCFTVRTDFIAIQNTVTNNGKKLKLSL